MIVSRQNPKLKAIRKLRGTAGDAVLLEGPHLVEEAIRLGLPFETVLATPDFLDTAAGRRIGSEITPRPLEVSPSLLAEVTDVDSPQGVLAVATLARSGPAELPRVAGGLYVYAEGMQDPGNLGALARTLEAAGGTALALSAGSVHPNHPRALRSSAGSLLRLPLARPACVEELDAALAEIGPTWVALSPRGGQPLFDTELTGTLVLAIGAEGSGLGAATERRCELAVTIPTAAEVESLNAAVAASIALFEIRRQRTA